MSDSKITMKLLVDKSKNRVLFGEARKDCVDLFLHILSLPLGTVVSFLTKESMVGSLGSLYKSVDNLETDYLQYSFDKNTLLNPKPSAGSASNVPLLAIDKAPNDSSNTKTMFVCSNSQTNNTYYNNVHFYVSDISGVACPQCNYPMTKTVTLAVPSAAEARAAGSSSNGDGGYVKGVVTYMIMDDLSVEPMSTISGITLLNKFNVQDVGLLEEKLVTLDVAKVMALLKASLVSKTVLTDVFLGKS